MPWPARSSPRFASLSLHASVADHAHPSYLLRSLPSTVDNPPAPSGAGGLAYPVRVFFNTTPGCRVRQPDERCRPIWTNRPPPSGEDRCVYPVGTASSVSWRVAHTHTSFVLSMCYVVCVIVCVTQHVTLVCSLTLKTVSSVTFRFHSPSTTWQ